MLAYFIGGISPTMDVANAALPAYVITLLFFVGLLIRAKDQPVWWHWCAPLPLPSPPPPSTPCFQKSLPVVSLEGSRSIFATSVVTMHVFGITQVRA